ncbi:hypothetical protein ACLOJK_038255, partial [Asimina triloba]
MEVLLNFGEKPSTCQFGWDVANGIFPWLGADGTRLPDDAEAVEDEEEEVELLVPDLATFVYIFMRSRQIWGELFVVVLLDGLDRLNTACHRWYLTGNGEGATTTVRMAWRLSTTTGIAMAAAPNEGDGAPLMVLR